MDEPHPIHLSLPRRGESVGRGEVASVLDSTENCYIYLSKPIVKPTIKSPFSVRKGGF